MLVWSWQCPQAHPAYAAYPFQVIRAHTCLHTGHVEDLRQPEEAASAVTAVAAAKSRPCKSAKIIETRARMHDRTEEERRQRAEAARVAAAAAAAERARQQAELDAHARLLQKQREECAPCCMHFLRLT